ncbi:MAG TPA: NADH:ubiquinone oxidoreductase subunit NDUFA12, partial [Hyphomicrobiaceae bacterium]|nr:NADH:ubiquinone oxidoreductase subunit NDUFA12 [Hyphomicrobiaceae bacterium]
TAEAYRPDGSILKSGRRPQATGDYKPWQPS